VTLKKEVLARLLLAKSILTSTRGAVAGQPNAHLVARQILSAHDAADLAFVAIADQQTTLPPHGHAPSMLKALALIETNERFSGYFSRLSNARDSLKHVGNLPNTSDWADVNDDTFDKISAICLDTLGVGLEDIDEIELLESPEVKEHVYEARRARDTGDFKLALEEIAKALYVALAESDLGFRIGSPNAEDALMLTGIGVSPNEFLRLQQFLPEIWRLGSKPFDIRWTQAKFGHPGNWRQNNVDFCLDAALELAFRIQNAASIPIALELSYVYNYKITVVSVEAEIWEDLIEGHLEEVYADNFRPLREHKRYAKQGESFTVSADIKFFVSGDQSLTGEWIRRVRISREPFEEIFATEKKAEFINLADVRIMCVPSALGMHFGNPPEIEWQDPEAINQTESEK
jgi:hypothetical protein